MTNQTELTETALEVVDRYIEPNSNLLAMQRIHRLVFNEETEFTAWQEVHDWYSDIEWDNNLLRNFAAQSKEVVENNQSSLSESYFTLEVERDLTVDWITAELNEAPYSSDDSGTDRDGFQYVVQENMITGRYIYTNIDTEITYSGTISKLTREGAVRFKIHPETSLLIIESSYPPDILRIRKAFEKLTHIKTENIASTNIDTNPHFEDFFQSVSTLSVPDEISIVELSSIEFKNPQQNDDVSSLSLELDADSLSHPEIQEHLENGWRISNISFGVFCYDDLFKVKLGINDKMTYLSISNINDFEKGRELVELLRSELVSAIVDN